MKLTIYNRGIIQKGFVIRPNNEVLKSYWAHTSPLDSSCKNRIVPCCRKSFSSLCCSVGVYGLLKLCLIYLNCGFQKKSHIIWDLWHLGTAGTAQSWGKTSHFQGEDYSFRRVRVVKRRKKNWTILDFVWMEVHNLHLWEGDVWGEAAGSQVCTSMIHSMVK